VIDIVGTWRDNAASNAQELSEVFQAILHHTPLVLDILRSCKRAQEEVYDEYTSVKRGNHNAFSLDVGAEGVAISSLYEGKRTTEGSRRPEIEHSNEAFEALMLACREDAEQLQEKFKKLVPDDAFANTAERYGRFARARVSGKGRKARDLMIDLLEKLQLVLNSKLLAQHSEQSKEKNKNNKELDTAISQLSELPSTPPEDHATSTLFGDRVQVGGSSLEGSSQNFYNIGSGNSTHLGNSYNGDFSFGTSNFNTK
jgi:hypothetical protein